MPTLYSYKESGNSYKVHLLAALLKIPLDVVEIDFITDEQHTPAFLNINPKGEVPTLADGNLVLTDSAAILVYLAGKSKSKYWSTDVAEQALIASWLAFAASWVQYGVFTARAVLSFGGPYNGLGRNADTTNSITAQRLKDGQVRGEKSLQVLDQHLGKPGREWLELERPTIADISVFVYVALAPMGDVSLEPFSNVRRWIEAIKRLPGFKPIAGLDDPSYRR